MKGLGIEESVKFLGRVMLPEIVDLYRSSDVFATASETETQGIVLIEAAATGLPLVAVDAGAVKEVCQNRRNGVLCKKGDVQAMARGLIRVLLDKDLRAKYSKESLEVSKNHDLRRTVKRFEEIYVEAIDIKREKMGER